MRILHVITSLDTGGAERLMVDLLPKLIEKGNQVELLLFNGLMTPFRKELEQYGVSVYELFHSTRKGRASGVYNPLNIFRLRKYLRKYDIIHTHNTACQLFVPIAKCLSGSSVKLVTTEHSSTSRRRAIRWLRPFDKWVYRRYAKIVCIGDSTLSGLVSYLGADCNACVIYNGVDTARFVRPIKDISQQSQYLVTMVAGFRFEKDHETVIRAFKHLPDNYFLQFVGDGARLPQMKSLSKELGVESKVAFLGKRMDVPDVLEKSDVVVLSSHWEGLSLSSIEGMASGRPFVASDVDGLRDVVSGAGVLFPHGDDKALAEAIQQLCENPSYYTEVAQACQSRAKEYDISVMADKYDQLYKELMLKK